MKEMSMVLRGKGLRRLKKQVSSKEPRKLKAGRKEKERSLGVEVCVSSCWPLVRPAEYLLCAGHCGRLSGRNKDGSASAITQ